MRRMILAVLCVGAAAVAAPAMANKLVPVVDLTAQGIDVFLQGFPPQWSGVDASGVIRVATFDGIGPGIPVYRIDPSTGSASLIAPVDPTSVGGLATQTQVAFGPGGEVYLLTSDGQIDPQQTVYRLDGTALTPVVDLTANGVELNLDNTVSRPVIGAADDGTLRFVQHDPMSADNGSFDVYTIDPAAGTASLLAQTDVPGMTLGSVSAIVATDGSVFFLADDSGPPVDERLYRLEGSTAVEVLDVTGAGFDVRQPLGGGVPGIGLRDGALVLVSPNDMAFGLFDAFRLEPASGRAALLGTIDLQSVTGSNLGGSGQAVVGRDGRIYLLASDGGMPAQETVQRLEVTTRLDRVIDLTAQGISIFTGMGPVRARVTDAGDLVFVGPHPSVPELRRVYTLRPAEGSASFDATVDLSTVGGATPLGETAIAPDGTVYFLIENDDQAQPQQTVQRLDGGALTQVIDVTGQGVTLDMMANSFGFPTGVDADGVITAVLQHPTNFDLRRVYLLAPLLGTAAFQGTVDLGVVATTPNAVPAFAPDGGLFFLVADGPTPGPEALFRLDGGALTSVVDLTAQGIEVPFGIPGTPPSTGVTDTGLVQVVSSGGASDPSVEQLVQLDPVAGTAELVSTLDFAATSVDPATAAVLPVLSGRADEAFFLVSDGAIPPQQGLYRLPEPGAGPAGGAAGAALIALLAGRRATRRR